MRSLERLEQQKRLERMKKRNVPPPDEEMEDELEHLWSVPLNKMNSVFDDGAGKMAGGINTAPSVFDKRAAIHTDG